MGDMDFSLDTDAESLLQRQQQENDNVFLRQIFTHSSSRKTAAPPTKRRKKKRKDDAHAQQGEPVTATIGAKLGKKNPLMHFSYYKKHAGSVVNKTEFTNAFARQFLEGETMTDAENRNDVIANKKYRTMFVTNPSCVAMQDVDRSAVEMLSCFGDIEAVHAGDLLPPQEHDIDHLLPSPFSDARVSPFHSRGTLHITFDTLDSLESAIGMHPQQQIDTKAALYSSLGLSHYRSTFASSVVPRKALSSEMSRINKWMKRHDKSVEREEALIDVLRNRPDPDGWTKVIAPRGRRHLPPMTEEGMMQKREEHLMKNGNSSNRYMRLKQQADQALERGASSETGRKQASIYRFQRVDQQKDRHALLREKFEKDKEIIDRMRKRRMFSSSSAKGNGEDGSLDG